MLKFKSFLLNFWNYSSTRGIENTGKTHSRYAVLTNQICIISGLLGSLMLLLYCYKGVWISVVSYSAFVSVMILVYLINTNKKYNLAKIILVFFIPLTAIVPRLLMAGTLAQEPIEYFCAFLVFSFVPQVIFDPKNETNWIIVSFIFYFVIISFYDFVIPGYIQNMHDTYNPTFVIFKFKQEGLFCILYLIFSLKNYSTSNLETDFFDIKYEFEKIKIQHNDLQNDLIQNKNNLNAHIDKLNSSNSRLKAHNDVIRELANSSNIKEGDFFKSISEIGNIIYKTLDISRVTIWSYDSFQHSIIAIFAVSDDEIKNTQLPIMYLDKYPLYFITLKNNKLLKIDDTQNSAALTGLEENYLSKYSIQSMLDIPFYLDGNLAGIICCENQYKKRIWEKEDIDFVNAMSEYLSLAFETSQKLEDKELIEKQNKELLKQHDYIKEINENLEQKIAERTKELVFKNEQFEKFIKANSHEIRGPIARILGVLNLYELNETTFSIDEFVKIIKTSTLEVDKVLYEINKILSEESGVESST